MNGEPVTIEHGQLCVSEWRPSSDSRCSSGSATEIVEDYRHMGKGQGRWREDNQYYGAGAGI